MDSKQPLLNKTTMQLPSKYANIIHNFINFLMRTQTTNHMTDQSQDEQTVFLEVGGEEGRTRGEGKGKKNEYIQENNMQLCFQLYN